MNFCPKCGNQLRPDASFCDNCGEQISLQASATPTQYNSEGNQSPPRFISGSGDFRMPNTQRRIVNLWYIISLVFLGCVFLPSIIGLNGMEGGFAVSFLSGFMVILGIIVIFIYQARARQLDKILKGEGRIAMWKYSPEEWVRYSNADFEAEKKMKRNLFFLVAGIAVVVGIILTAVVQDALVMLIIAGIISLVAVPAIWAPRYRLKKLQHSEAHVLIAEKGVIVGKLFHLWVQMGASLDKIELNMETDPKLIEFTYSMPDRTGRSEQVARVPVPYGKMDEAMSIVAYFNTR
jgi:hypothetical protein